MGIIYNAARPVLHAGSPTNGTSEVQTIDLGGTPTGGTFILTHEGFSTTAITWTAVDATLIAAIEAALVALPSIGTGGCAVADGTLTSGIGTVTVTFAGNRARQPVGAISYISSLTGTAPTITVTETTPGVSATHRGCPKGQRLIDTNRGYEYVNMGTALVPSWRIAGVVSYACTPATLATAYCKAAVTDNGAQQVITTGITNPDVPRCLTATAGGTAGDIKAIQVTVAGTDIDGNAISEVLPAFTVDTAGSVTGSKAFKTITSITIPAHDGTGATTAVGVGDKLGLPVKLSRNTVIAAYLGGTKEGTAPTVAVSATALESNTVDLNSANNSTEVVIDFHHA